MKKALLLLLALLVLLGGCAATSEESATPGRLGALGEMGNYDYDKNGGMVASGASTPPMVASVESVATTAPSMATTSGYSTPAAPSSRKLIYNVSITMETLEYEETLPAIKARCLSAGGYIEGASEVGVNLNSCLS